MIRWLNAWDYILNGILSNILEALFSTLLLIRIIWRRYYSTKTFQWKKYRKMAFQLLSISALSLTINFPQSLIILVRQIIPNMSDFAINIEPYFFYFTGYIILLLPFVCICSLPELWPKSLFKKINQRTVVPMTITTGFGETVLAPKNRDRNFMLHENWKQNPKTSINQIQ